MRGFLRAAGRVAGQRPGPPVVPVREQERPAHLAPSEGRAAEEGQVPLLPLPLDGDRPEDKVKAGPLVVFLDICTLHEQLGDSATPAVRVISAPYPVLLEVDSPAKQGSKVA